MQIENFWRLETYTVTVANGAQSSDAIDLDGRTPMAIVTPSALTGTSLSFEASANGTTYYDVYTTAGAVRSITIGASRYIPLEPNYFFGIKFIKLKCGSAQAAERTIMLLARHM